MIVLVYFDEERMVSQSCHLISIQSKKGLVVSKEPHFNLQ